jgi:phosphoglycerate dehydrogenase-like enzyme
MLPRLVESVYGDDAMKRIAAGTHLLHPPIPGKDLVLRPELLREVEVIFGGWGMPRLDQSLLDAAPQLRAVFYAAGSVRGFMTDEAWRRDLIVSHAAALNAIPVSEYCLAMTLLALKHAWRYARSAQKEGCMPALHASPGAYGSRVGLVSLGSTGRLFLKHLQRFDIEVWAHDPFVSAEEMKSLKVRSAELDELFASCDVVSLHTPLLDSTKGMITGRHFELMKHDATFLNTARGAVVREAEMIEVLGRRPDLTAILDVTSPEPPLPGSPFYSLPNVILTPHIAGSHHLECRRMGAAMVEEFGRWRRGEALHWQVCRQRSTLLA